MAVKNVVEKDLGDWRVQIVEYDHPHFWQVSVADTDGVYLSIGAVRENGTMRIWTPAVRSRRFNKEVKTIIVETVAKWLRAGKFIPASHDERVSARKELQEGPFLMILRTGDDRPEQRRRFNDARKAMDWVIEKLGDMPYGAQGAMFRTLAGTNKWMGPIHVFEKEGHTRGSVRSTRLDAWAGGKP
ncbi:MAG: hypothetical protein ACHREM_08790 [Polyangiales bacterium]